MTDDSILKAAAKLGVLGGRASAAQTLRLLTNPAVSVADVARSIDQEPTLAARVLRVANSAYYGLQREISTVESAAVMLGLDVLRAIAAAACFDSALMQSRSAGATSIEELRSHCIASAVAADALARQCHRELAPTAFMAGLLHDLGILILLALGADDPDDEDGSAGKPRPTHEHCAALTFEVWGLPDALVAAARHHHHPDKAPEAHRRISAIVHLADSIAKQAGLGLSVDGPSTIPSQAAAMAVLGLDNDAITELTEALPERVGQLARALSG